MSANGPASPGRWHDVQLLNTIGAICSVKVRLSGLGASPPEKAVTVRAQAAANIVQRRFIVLLLPLICNNRLPGFGASTRPYRSRPHPMLFADLVQWLSDGACRALRRRYRYGHDTAPCPTDRQWRLRA